MGDDGRGHGVKRGANFCPPSACNTLRPLGGHDNALAAAGQMEGQALGLGEGVGRDLREKIELRIKLGHVDGHGWGVPMAVACLEHGLKLRPVTVQPRANLVRIKPFKAEARR